MESPQDSADDQPRQKPPPPTDDEVHDQQASQPASPSASSSAQITPQPDHGLPPQPPALPTDSIDGQNTPHQPRDDLPDDEGTTPTPAEPKAFKLASLPPPNIDPNQADMSADVPGGQSSSWSTSSDRQLGAGPPSSASSAADPADRVYPIRSVVSVGQSQPTPWVRRTSGEFEYFPRHETWDGRHRLSKPRIDTENLPSSTKPADTVPASASSCSTSPKGLDQSDRRRRKSGHESITSLPSGTPGPMRTVDPSAFFSDDATSDNSERAEGSSLSRSESIPNFSAGHGAPGQLNENLVAVRFKHVVTKDGHAVITGRDGNLQRCEDEPIHTPGAVQSFGFLVALSEESDGRFLVRIVSENSKQIIGYTPQQLFRVSNFMDIFSEDQADNMIDHVDFIRDEDADNVTKGPEVFSVSVKPPKGKSTKLWCAIHIPASHPDLIVCEFELEDDHIHPLRPPEEAAPPAPEDTLYQNPTLEEFNESTEVSSKPLRVLRSARRKQGAAGAMQVFDIMSQVQEQLAAAPNLTLFLKILVGIVKELTGFHRVMVYQFDAAFNGKVVTELVDPAHTRDLYKGLHFPASDIPEQARNLYKLNKVRLLYDRDLESARLVCRSVEDLERPLDLSHAYLRAMSPIHTKYLANMAVRASMSISITAFDELWGLIACHSYGDKGMRVAFPIRKMCRLIGDTASRNIERLSYAARLQARKLINTVPTEKNPSGYIIASSDDLLRLFDADFGMVSIRDETKILGKIEQSQEALAMLEYLRLKKFDSVMTTQDITEDFSDLHYPPGFTVIAGLLYVPLSVLGQDFIVLFRKGQTREVKWAGNPYEKVIREGTRGFLEPRSSFQVWHETVVGKCKEWTEDQIETAAVLCLVYGKFIEVWRQKEAALQSSRLTRLLLANSAHEVRTPLNAIINFLEIALEGTLDQETRDNLTKSHSASRSLIYVINDLLDLTKTEEGNDLVKDEIMDLPACIKEATDPFYPDAKRKRLRFDVVQHQGVPRFVHGDPRRVRQAVANVTANAFQHTSHGFVRVECFVSEVMDDKARVEITVQDTGRGMTNDQLDALFEDLEQVSSDVDDFRGEVEDSDDQSAKSRESRTLGLGLAVVARIVRNMGGQLRLKSEVGNGSRFVIQLPFELPSSDILETANHNDETGQNSTHSATSTASVTKLLPPAEVGEVMLVDREDAPQNNSHAHPPPGRRHSLPERRSSDGHSISSYKSGRSKFSDLSNKSSKSDADRLIDAIQTPLAMGKPESEASTLLRHGSMDKLASHKTGDSGKSLPSAGRDSSNHPSATGPLERPGINGGKTTTPSGPSMAPSPPPAGFTYQTDTKTPIRPIKIPDEYKDLPSSNPQPSHSSGVLFEIPDKTERRQDKSGTRPRSSSSSRKLQVLIAEDDPINMRILSKRLEKAEHKVSQAMNGEDCATVYSENPQDFGIILMDMQMPIVDGLTSTKMIRAFEKSDKCQRLSPVAQRLGRVPIFAVSASLVEREKATYVDAGFDGWILKPIDFKRLHTLLAGITDDAVRNDSLYVPGKWEQGGWFERRSVPNSSSTNGISNNEPGKYPRQ